jgi:hypothetical protein
VNRATASSSAGEATALNATSAVQFGITEKDFTTLLSTETQLQGLVDFVVARFGVPEYRVENVTVNLRSVSSEQETELLGLELGSEAQVVFTPNGIGDPISLRYRVIGISHDVTPDSHTMSFAFQELQFQFFVLDDAVFGILDGTEAVLGF